MRSYPRRISLQHAARHIHSSLVPLPLLPWRPPARCFHQTAPVCLPRKRSFFTSNPYLSPAGDESKPALSSPSSPVTATTTGADPSTTTTTTPTKRKPTRAATTKNSLRRVAIIAQQPKRGAAADTPGSKPPPSSAAAAAVERDPSTVVSAVCLAEGFHMPTVVEILSSQGFATDPDGTGFDAGEVVHARRTAANGDGGDVFVFPSGTLVTWALPPDAVARQLLPAAEDPHPLALREAEGLDFIYDPQRDASSVRGDVVVLGTRHGDRLDTTLAKVAFSSGLARSTKLAVLEASLASYFESTRHVPDLLARGGGPPLSRRFVLGRTGELLGLRARLNHYSELTDALPDLFWDSRSELGLDGYYEQVGRALDVGVRIRALNQKMDYAQEIAAVLREVASERHGTRLEWIIIVLIAVEVVFELRRIVLEWRQEREEGAAEAAPA
ncbi:hypothetical protein ISF_08460 [Cordyceps fumosorosea ARSEF 2679]|uniref:DUF155 domain-containing protein n=1 Tax=Cordyceps fumosorosea (strain ARSEF 2679) TaxID=1081104 RepID=A0A162JXG3_CORFA|nr:hypothetical protein ISF_08460 [Cordyceps fumosorosea ARSEF 2679]OAA54233.1 hypothetical protein ISF_08460 [Cordyceps fumosorosea ARSEF 2679]